MAGVLCFRSVGGRRTDAGKWLPMVITSLPCHGQPCQSKKQTIIKDINAMQGFGSMDVLCMDKTGTLTNESILLEYYMDILGK